MHLYRNTLKYNIDFSVYLALQPMSICKGAVYLLEALGICTFLSCYRKNWKALMAGAGSSGPGSRKPGVGTQEAQAPGSLSFPLPPLQSKVLQMAQDPLN